VIPWRMIGRVAACVMGGVLLLGLIVVVLWQSRVQAHAMATAANAAPPRLRWHVVARTQLPRGTKLGAEHLDGRLGWVPDVPGPTLVPAVSRAEGRYLVTDVEPGTPLALEAIASAPALTAPAGGAVAVVSVDGLVAALLAPGMTLGFVAAIPPEPPKSGPVAAAPVLQPFRALAVVAPPDRGERGRVVVEVAAPQLAAAARLSRGEWVPIVLAPGTVIPDEGRAAARAR
jgi:hypothetical protein